MDNYQTVSYTHLDVYKRQAHASGQDKRKRASINEARANAPKLEYSPIKPKFLGTKAFDNYPLADLVPFIDWTPFFSSWQLAGSYPAILNDDLIGEAATNLFNDAQKMLEKLVAENWIKARAVIGLSLIHI